MKRYIGLTLLFVIALASLTVPDLIVRSQTPAPKVTAAGDGSLHLVVLTRDKTVHLQIAVETDGRPLGACWDDVFTKLCEFLDRDGDGSLNPEEAKRLPSAFTLRQVLWAGVSHPTGSPPSRSNLAAKGTDKVGPAELSAYYRQNGFGSVLIAVGKPPSTTALTDALIRALDADGDKTVGDAEWKGAPDLLKKLDTNDDELLGPGELVSQIAYPGSMGSMLLTAPSPTTPKIAELESVPLLVMSTRKDDTHWAGVLLKRRDKDGNGRLSLAEAGLKKELFSQLDGDQDQALTVPELARLAQLPPDQRLVIRTGPGETPVHFSLRENGLWLELRGDPGKLPELAKTANKRYRDMFSEADKNGDGLIEAGDLLNRDLVQLKSVLDVADRDGNDKLNVPELTAWLELQNLIAQNHILLTVLDQGPGLFELLDANHDGALSLRELRGVHEQARSGGCLGKGQLDRTLLPWQLACTVSAGHPRSALATSLPHGPVWFQGMDRNGDGDLSPREFVGPVTTFQMLDTDRDGLISASEAEKTGKRNN